ncbi:MAG: hypothetical protein WA324_28360 [Bryobacteraceae bacterium]
MSETGPSFESRTEKREERTLNLLEQIVLGSKIATGLLALTYVSGYLISTTYLSTYGISADASDLLRAKYIYIGFQYWMGIIAFAVVARVAAVALDSPKLLSSRPPGNDDWIARRRKDDAADKERREAREALELRSAQGNSRNRRGHYRHVRLAALILSLFAIEIMLLKPGSFLTYLPLQTIFLLSIILYQTTFYREYSSRSYGWGTSYGKNTVDRMRSLYGIKIAFLMVLLLAGTWLSGKLALPQWSACAHSIIHWIATIAVWLFSITLFFYILGGSIFVVLNSETLKSLEVRRKLRHSRLFPLLGLHFVVVAPILYVYRKRRDSHGTMGFENSGCFRGDLRRDHLKRRRMHPCVEMSYLSTFRTGEWDNRIVPIVAGAVCLLALTVLVGEHPFWLAAVLDYSSLALAMVILSNLLVLSYMHFKKHKDLEVKYSFDWHSWILIGIECGVLYLVSVFGFSYLVYPFLPLEKAGGAYLRQYAITVNVNHAESGCSSTPLDTTFEPRPPYVLWRRTTSQAGNQPDFVVLEQDPNWSYLAPVDGPNAGGGPDAWKWWALCDEYYGSARGGSGCRPLVYVVNRRCIADTVGIDPR